MSMQKKETLPL